MSVAGDQAGGGADEIQLAQGSDRAADASVQVGVGSAHADQGDRLPVPENGVPDQPQLLDLSRLKTHRNTRTQDSLLELSGRRPDVFRHFTQFFDVLQHKNSEV
jgi:hypothetical protein